MTTTLNASTAGAGGFIATSDNSGVLALQTAGTTAVTVDTSQNVGIGTSSPTSKLHVAGSGFISDTFQVSGTATTVNANGIGLEFRGSITPSIIAYSRVGSAYLPMSTSASLHTWDTSGTERMRINSSGNLLLNTTSALFDGKFFVAVPCNTFNPIALQNTTTQGAGQSFMFMANSAGNKAGSIDHTGTTTVAYTTSSDYRMKENIAPMTGALTAVLQLKPCTYTWKEDGKAGQGFIAHELQAIVPDCVSGEKDAVDADGNPKYQGIDTSFLVATLTAALQETKALIDTQDETLTQQTETINALTARIVALESRGTV